eukprot:TRINITY_DN3137_c0_g2_i1.p1 TRINITY_DN3137_c0_g2~~TRINITY_DN3137_c0_g2_i1.p1  ORF type:complete len:300 (+),score=145.51 TRINITY_DN3137_c0_g2_i1:182-1081(+)
MATYHNPTGNRYSLEQKLGEGTYGEVYKGFDTVLKIPVAVKKIRSETNSEGIAGTELREISILRNLKHKNVVRMLDVVTYSHKLLLVFECCESDLRQVIKKGEFRGRRLKSMMHQLLTGLAFCHSHRIIHRDLKPQNLLVTGDVLKIADFGLARAFQVPLPAYTHEVVTLWYRAPEILLGEKRYSTVVDTWSCGVIMPEMATKSPLFPGDCEIDELFQVFRLLGTPDERTWPGVTLLPDYKPVFPKWGRKNLADVCREVDALGIDLLGKLLTYDPSTRITAAVAAQHPWFNELHMASMP